MGVKTVLVIDDHVKNIEVLVSGLVNNGLQVVTATSGHEGFEKAEKLKPDVVLMDTELPDLNGIEFALKAKNHPDLSAIPVVLLSTRGGIQDRLKAYEAGVKDYIVKPLHVSEIVARIKMLLMRMERRLRDQESRTGKMHGNLRDKTVPDLVVEFSLAGVTGLLNLVNENGKSGQIFFRDGQVVNALVGSQRGERAFYEMVPWGTGRFTMLFQDIDIKDEINLSNMGLLLQARKRLEKRNLLLKELPGLDTVFTLSSTFLKIIEKKTLSSDIQRFIQLFDGQRTVRQILDDSFYDQLVTLERVVKMYQQGFLTEIGRNALLPEEGKTKLIKLEALLSAEEYETFQKQSLEGLEDHRKVLLIMGAFGSGKSEMVRTLAGPTYQTRMVREQFPHPIDLGKVLLANDHELRVVGVPVEKNLHLFVETFADFMMGYIVLVNAIQPETFEYLSYLIKTFRSRYTLPYCIAVSNLRHAQAPGYDVLTSQLGLESFEELIPCNPADKENIKMVLLNMRSTPESRGELRAQYKIRHFT